MKKTTHKFISNIQAIRALACMNVVFFHSLEAAKSYGMSSTFFHRLDGWGQSGVDLFFVVSGFIMVYTQFLQKRNPLQFMIERFYRIAPMYWLLTLFMGMLLLLMPTFFRQMSFSNSWLFSSVFFLSAVIEERQPILYLGWTLEYEMFFYSLFSVSLFLRKTIHSILFCSLLILLSIYFFNLDLIVIEFIFGMVAAYFHISLSESKRLSSYFAISGILLYTLSITLKDSGLSRVLIYGIPGFFIVFGLSGTRQMINDTLSLLGNASYSIYLIQVFTIPIFFKVIKYLKNEPLTNELNIIISFATTILSGILVYIFIEKKIALLTRPTNKATH